MRLSGARTIPIMALVVLGLLTVVSTANDHPRPPSEGR